MTHSRQTILASRPAAAVLALSLVAGLSVPFLALPPVHAALPPPSGTTELSATPPNVTQAVSPNIVVTFDDSGSMASDYMGDERPFNNSGWGSTLYKCAGVINPNATSGIETHVMNGVYYNPNVTYDPPLRADGTEFPDADSTLKAVWDDGIAQNRKYNQQNSTTTDFTNQPGRNKYWICSGNYDLGRSGNNYRSTTKVPGGGPYYYEYTGPTIAVNSYGNPTAAGITNIYTDSNWEAVAVPSSQYQNWANWWAYYRTRNQMARTSVSRAFGQLGTLSEDGHSFGGAIRIAWQNLYTSDTFHLQAKTIISALIDANAPTACDAASVDPAAVSLVAGTTTTAPPNCYRSAFFNWIFNVDATGNTPSRAATIRTGQFFMRGSGNTGKTGDLHDPYWQPPAKGTFDADANAGNELVCRQNFQMLVTDGYSNETSPGKPSNANNAGSPFRQVTDGFDLPDGTAYSTSAAESRIYWDQSASGVPTTSMANIAFNYWATDLRPDLYASGKARGITNPVAPYMPDSTTGVVTGATSDDLEKYFNPNNDPANWPHMVQYMVTLGVSGTLINSNDYDCKNAPDDACGLRLGDTLSNGTKGWPSVPNNVSKSIDDVWHATVSSRGQYFNAGNPEELITQLSSILTNIAARSATPTTGAANSSVTASGALSFSTGYDSGDWFGVFQAFPLEPDGSVGTTVTWDAGAQLDATSASSRHIYTAAYDSGTSTLNPFAFTTGNAASLDATETAGLGPATPTTNDTLANRIDYVRGDQTHETDGTFRKRTHLLGAIINSQPVYVSYASSGYHNSWPSGSPEALAAAASNGHDDKSYDAFIADHIDRPGRVYVGANDGMLHAFDASLACSHYDAGGVCDGYGPDQAASAGSERWAFIPRAVYANLGNLTNASSFKFRPTVDGTPVTRDVFFASDTKWHTILTGGVGLGGRGVYALDITDPSTPPAAPSFSKSDVLWEFDSDMAADSGCVSIVGTSEAGSCSGTDLGYTVSQPNVGRLPNGEWVVLVPNGYFPDCTKSDTPTNDVINCQKIAAQAPKDASGNPYSALFVLDAETGKMIAELKTPTIPGVSSFGLATPVLGDYDNDQIDDVAFAGDLQGNLWRFNLSGDPADWKVTLAYQAPTQGVQPITTMPRLFPDSTTGRFMVVFGTGKYLGADDNSTTSTQAIYGIRDSGECATANGCAVQQTNLVPQTLTEELAPATLPDGTTPNPNAGATLRLLTDNPVPANKDGWYINLYTTTSGGVQNNAGERVVVTPGAVFASNTVIVQTLITGAVASGPCNPSAQGAVMAINTNNGGPGTGVSSLGGYPVVGGRVSNVRTSGTLPVVSAVGGGALFIPGVNLSGAAKNSTFSVDAPMWRRRSWSEILQNQ